MAVKAITFDFWLTLFRLANGPARVAMRARALADAAEVPEEEAAEAISGVNTYFFRHHMINQWTLHPDDAVRLSMRRLGVALPEPVVADLAEVFATAIVEHGPVPCEDIAAAVDRAAERFPVGIVSDTGLSPGRSLRKLLEQHGLLDRFTFMAFSDEVGEAKPRARMFRTAADGLGVEPHELVHIGDLEMTDIAGARAVGARAVLFTGANDRHAGRTRAHHEFSNWRDFTEAFEEVIA
jgi:putative hydrolase of the HAD superfamily